MHKTYNYRPVPHTTSRQRSRKPNSFIAALIVVALAYCALALLRPVPDIHIVVTPPVVPALVKVNIPWPTSPANVQAAYGADGYGLLDSSGPETPVPTASVAKAITALVVLDKKPLKPGEQGPAITMTAHDVELYNKYVAIDGSVVPVSVGQTISEYQALQALLLPSANNIADTLAEWAFGSLSAYNTYANSYVKKLNMTNTTVTDASGFAPTTVCTASDLVRLGDAALDNPVLADIINQQTAEFPDYGTVHSTNTLLGQSGIRGIKTGNTDEAGGCYLSAADVMIGDKKITVITAVMGAPNIALAMRSSLPLIQSSPSQFQNVHVVRTGQSVGRAAALWGASSDITAAKGITVTAWTGTSVAASSTKSRVTAPAAADTPAGTLSHNFNGTSQSSDVELTRAIAEPSIWWRLAHPL